MFFVPTNKAFDKLAESLIQSDNKATLTKILTYHKI
ncbi:MAG: fasciclin domain-containing protein [Chitinophagaceae bacterium]